MADSENRPDALDPARRLPAGPSGDALDSVAHPYRAPARSVECVSCHRHFVTRAGSRALLCARCRTHFHGLAAQPSTGGST